MSLSKFTLNLFRKNDIFHSSRASLSTVTSKRGLGSAQPDIEKNPEKYDDKWNKAVADAEKLVGHKTSLIGLRYLLSEEVENVAVHVRKLSGSKHPLVKTVKKLIYNASNNVQTWGLVILLISKALGHNSKITVTNAEACAGYLHSQRALAEITEMIRTSHVVHRGLMNLSKDNTEEELRDVVNGNKIALLSGDHLLSTSCLELAKLKNQDLVELMSSAVRDLSESEFIGLRDDQNLPLPSPPRKNGVSTFKLPENTLEPINSGDALGVARAEWTLRSILEGGNLLGKACQGALILAGHSTATQTQAYRFGLNLALAWQIRSELLPFAPGFSDPFSLVSAPVLFTLQNDPELYKEIQKGQRNVHEVNYEKLRGCVLSGPGIELTKDLLKEHCKNAYEFLGKLPDSDARGAMESMLDRISDTK
ncbi:all trans-polyprenyl-diphosphate synthase PDSS2 [Coccinella septempunctata]|uniref:all trans-polyprenyl-diphosphate synthase PDSS2 n=1 Tax=Coccinella septempunctata TaxID=41139 RepID=UPI001D069E05|nr:all trans-polyprenyl-diphosphate synthase PDSS2 [Coccinella septempunctata]